MSVIGPGFAQARVAAALNVAELFEDQAARHPGRTAIQDGERAWTYAELDERVNRLCGLLRARGVRAGDRIAVLSENRGEYVQALLAAARLGVIVACMNWRQAEDELLHCITLVEPRLALVSPRHAARAPWFGRAGCGAVLMLDDVFEADLAACDPGAPPVDPVDPEDGLYILYTSGTTGKPKAALISHRALLARCALSAMDGGFRRGSTFICWPPLFHMVSADQVLMTLINGGKVVLLDGFQLEALCDAVERETDLGWLVLMPGMSEKVIDEFARRGTQPQRLDSVGCMADLVPRHQIAEITRTFDAPFRNTFGSTETGSVPGGGPGSRVAVGVVAQDLGKSQSSMCRVRLVDEAGREVAPGEPGELLVRSPTLFSGYWGMPEATAEAFEGGWFHTGDVFVRQADATLQFVDRRKYLIKSGGENIYPAEIEQVLLASPRIVDAAVVRKPDARWGEVPVAFVAPADETLTAEEVLALCRGRVAGYKIPREVRFIRDDALPRSTTGKVIRHELEALLKKGDA